VIEGDTDSHVYEAVYIHPNQTDGHGAFKDPNMHLLLDIIETSKQDNRACSSVEKSLGYTHEDFDCVFAGK
jgi:hypothetical protein